MTIRKARAEELPQIMALYEGGRAFMRRTGNMNQWINGYPGEELLLQDIANGNLYVAEADGRLEAVFAFIGGEDPTYAYIDGAWKSDRPYYTIHRIATSMRIKGLSGQIFAWCAEKAGGSLCADTHEDNAPMRHVLEKFGFEYCGTIYLEDGAPRRAYQYLRENDENRGAMTMDYLEYAVTQSMNMLAIPSPTGFTRAATDYLLKELCAMGYRPERTVKGTVWCDLGGEGHPMVLSAHVDTLGAMVRSVKANGRIRFTHIGGWQEATVETENCLVHTRDGRSYSGTVQHVNASQHVYRAMGEQPRNEETLEVVLDELVKSAEDVKKLGIDTGCYISWDPRTVRTPSGFLKSRHLDDKASSGVLLALARAIREGDVKPARRVYILFTVYEEVGHGAASLPVDGLEEMLAVDMGCVGDDLACDETKVSICCKDSSGPYNYDMTSKLIRLAEENHLDYAVDVYPHYGSDAGAALGAGAELRHALIGQGVFASHGYERTHIRGIDNTLKLACAYVQAMP